MTTKAEWARARAGIGPGPRIRCPNFLIFVRSVWPKIAAMPCKSSGARTKMPSVMIGVDDRDHGTTVYWDRKSTRLRLVVVYVPNGRTTFNRKVAVHELLHARGFRHGKRKDGDFNRQCLFDSFTTHVEKEILGL